MLPLTRLLARTLVSSSAGAHVLRLRCLTAAATTYNTLSSRSFSTKEPRQFSTAAAFESEHEGIILEPLTPVATSNEGGFAEQKPLSDFELSTTTSANLQKVGITHLFPVQAQSFAVMMNGSDIVGRSKTGSGKTLAFALPIVEKILKNKSQSKNPRALILLPTRELSIQVSEEVKRIAPQVRVVNMVGGVSYTLQENHLRRGADIIVGTPGRIMDMVDKGFLSLSEVETSVLDEADMMLKFGFQEAVETILGYVGKDQQCVMWSATFPKWVDAMAKKYLKKPVSIDLVGSDDNHVPTTVSHKAILAPLNTRTQLLDQILSHHAKGGQALVFTETKQEVDEIANALGGTGVKALHGDLSQGMRTATMNGFRNGSVRTLVCTDIAARGLDISSVELVVQYRLPSDKESFVHRAGRTGRAGRSGTNLVLFDRRDVRDIKDFERRYKFSFNHAAAPSHDQMLAQAVADVTAKLTVPNDSSLAFEEAAQQLYEAQGISALSGALALLCGFEKKSLSSVSMLTGKARMATMHVEGAKSAREIHSLLEEHLPTKERRDIRSVDSKFVFDVPHESTSALQKSFAENNLVLEKTVELPRVVVEAGAGGDMGNSRNSRFSRDSRGGNRSFGGGRGGRSGGFSRGGGGGGDRGGFRSDSRRRSGGDRDFDSGFSGKSKRSGFGRYSDNDFSDRPRRVRKDW